MVITVQMIGSHTMRKSHCKFPVQNWSSPIQSLLSSLFDGEAGSSPTCVLRFHNGVLFSYLFLWLSSVNKNDINFPFIVILQSSF